MKYEEYINEVCKDVINSCGKEYDKIYMYCIFVEYSISIGAFFLSGGFINQIDVSSKLQDDCFLLHEIMYGNNEKWLLFEVNIIGLNFSVNFDYNFSCDDSFSELSFRNELLKREFGDAKFA